MKAFAIFFAQPLSYRDGIILQEALLDARIKDKIPDVVLFLEHLPVITCGVRTKPAQILLTPDELKQKGIEIAATSRGGAATYHGPGQIIMYPIVKLGLQDQNTVAGLGEAGPGSPTPATTLSTEGGSASGGKFLDIKVGMPLRGIQSPDGSESRPYHLKSPCAKSESNRNNVQGYLHNLEEIAIRTAASFGVTAYRRKGMTGVWTDQGKLAAIGVRFKRWVAWHGLSFNVDLDLSGFETIIPCGLAGEKVTSLKLLLGDKCPPVEKARERLATHFSSVCARDLTVIHRQQFSASQLPSLPAMLH